MGRLHFENGGRLGGALRGLADTSGIWQLGSQPAPYLDLIPTGSLTISTALGFPAPTSQGSNSYYFASRKLSIFYTDAYGTVTHINQTEGSASYTDVRHIANDDGQGSGTNTFLVSSAGSNTGYIYDAFVLLSGARFYGTYSSVTLENQGSQIISTFDGTSWTDRATIPGVAAMNSQPGFTHTFAAPILAKGIRIRPTSISTYCPLSFFAGINAIDNTVVLGLQ